MTVKVDLKTKATDGGGDERAIHPNGYVPLLELDDGAPVRRSGDLPVRGRPCPAGEAGSDPEELNARQRDRLAGRFDWIAQQLEGRDDLIGESTVADAKLFTVLTWSGWTGTDRAKWPALPAYVASVATRPAVQAERKAEGLTRCAHLRMAREGNINHLLSRDAGEGRARPPGFTV
jgi:glutathione S-transferase